MSVGLGVLARLHSAALAEPSAASPEQLARLQDILSRPEFRAAEGQGTLLSFMDPVRAVLAAVLLIALRWLSALFAATGDAPGYTLIGLAFIVAPVAVVLFQRLVRGTVAAEGELASDATEQGVSADHEWELASRLAREGDLRGAVHHQYLAVLRRLDERGLLPFDRSLTNIEHLRRASGSPSIRAALEPLVGAFDRLWYGQPGCSQEEYEQFAGLAGRVWRTTR